MQGVRRSYSDIEYYLWNNSNSNI